MSEHHKLEPYPVPKDKDVLYINEPWLIDKSIYFETIKQQQEKIAPESEEDNIRIYLPMDLNKNAILRRLRNVIYQYGEATEENESGFSVDVDKLISQIEIYDQVWYVRHMPKDENQRHSNEAKELVKEFVKELGQIPDGGAEMFPFETIDELKEEYLGD